MTYHVFDLIEEITRLDGSTYIELGNITHNGRAEYAAEHGLIQSVRILKLKIPHSQRVERLEKYLNETYEMPPAEFDTWIEWEKTPEMQAELEQILLDNKLG
jgi:hypothetical protein